MAKTMVASIRAGHLFSQSLAGSGFHQDGSYLMSNVIQLPVDLAQFGSPKALHYSRARRTLLVAFNGMPMPRY
jgi:hypothetical protein